MALLLPGFLLGVVVGIIDFSSCGGSSASDGCLHYLWHKYHLNNNLEEQTVKIRKKSWENGVLYSVWYAVPAYPLCTIGANPSRRHSPQKWRAKYVKLYNELLFIFPHLSSHSFRLWKTIIFMDAAKCAPMNLENWISGFPVKELRYGTENDDTEREMMRW